MDGTPVAAGMQEAVPPGSPRVAVQAMQPGDADLGALARELERIRSMDPRSFGENTRLSGARGWVSMDPPGSSPRRREAGEGSPAFASVDSPSLTRRNQDGLPRSAPSPPLSPSGRRVGDTRVVRRKSQESHGEQRSTAARQTSRDGSLKKDSKLVSGGWQVVRGCAVSKAFLPALSSEILHFTHLNAAATRPQPWSGHVDKEAELAAAAQPGSAKSSALVHPAALVAVSLSLSLSLSLFSPSLSSLPLSLCLPVPRRPPSHP